MIEAQMYVEMPKAAALKHKYLLVKAVPYKKFVKAVESLKEDIVCEKDMHPALREKLIELIDKRFG